jgi:pyruvate/2-oxoglutarate dehydrogenase complex dihydrolipoamide acyltransferase (E2) component
VRLGAELAGFKGEGGEADKGIAIGRVETTQHVIDKAAPSNFGMIAGKYAAPIVVPPTVAILGAGRMHDAVVAKDGKAVVHAILPLSLTFDHRVVTGGEAARFLAAVIDDLELAD